METEKNKPVRVEVAETTLLRLLSHGQVCAADFRCLDCESKQCFRRLCLKSCVKPPGKKLQRAAGGVKSDLTVLRGSAIKKERCPPCLDMPVAPVMLETA